MSDNVTCPICGKPWAPIVDGEPPCEHLIMGLYHDTDCVMEISLSPVWAEYMFYPLSLEIESAADDVFSAMEKNPGLLSNLDVLNLQGLPESLVSLLKSSAKMLKTRGDDDEDESFFEYLSYSGSKIFAEYLKEVQTDVDGEAFSGENTISHSPGLEWETTYFWSRDAKATAERVADRVYDDARTLEKLQGEP